MPSKGRRNRISAGTYVVLEPVQLSRVELLVLVEPLDVVADLLDRLIDLLAMGGVVGHLSLQGGHIGSCQLELAGRFLLLLQLAGHVDRSVQVQDLAFHFGQRRLEPVERLLLVLR